jgi:methylated-DNA-[protein]-cysteine S-methyltransferase
MTGRRKPTADININRRLGPQESRWIADAAAYLESMFQGRHPEVCPRIKLGGQTTFTRRVLKAAMEIPWGETRSYSWVARRIGEPGAARAVGQALGRNPVPLMIPCHRVIKEDGSLGGFGQGTDWKERLLELERGGKGL